MKKQHIREQQNKDKTRLLAGKQAVTGFGGKKKQIKDVFLKEGLKILQAKPEHIDRIKIKKVDDMPVLYNTNFSLRTDLTENIRSKINFNYKKIDSEKTKNNDKQLYSLIHGPKEFEEQGININNLSEEEDIKYKLEWRELIKKAHNDFNEMFPPEKFIFAFFGSFLNFAKGRGNSGYNTLPGDLDADADISQFGQYILQIRKVIKDGGDVVSPEITGTGKGYPKLRFYNKNNKEINIFEAELTDQELENILKKTLEKQKNIAFYGAFRMTRKTKSKNTKFEIENEIYFNMPGKGLTQISNDKDALTQVDRDTVYIEVDGKKRRYLNERSQTRMYAMNLIYEADMNKIHEHINNTKGIKLASRIQKTGELNPGLKAYKLLPLLLKVRLGFIMQAKNKLAEDNQVSDFDEYITSYLDPYLAGAIITDKLKKSIGFDKRAEELFAKKNKEEIQKDKKDLLLNRTDAPFMFISAKYPKVANLIEKARKDLSISVVDYAYISLTKTLEEESPGLPQETKLYLLNWILRKKLDLRDLQNIELVGKIQIMKSYPNSIGDKLVKFYKLMDKFLEKDYKKILIDAEIELFDKGFKVEQPGSLIKYLERFMKDLGESYNNLQGIIKTISKKRQNKQESKKNIIYLIQKVKEIESACIELGDNLENLILFSLKEDSIRSFALYSAGIDVRDSYLDPVREQVSRLKTYLKTGTLPSVAGSLRELFPQDLLENDYRIAL